jgi:hypothetical protein
MNGLFGLLMMVFAACALLETLLMPYPIPVITFFVIGLAFGAGLRGWRDRNDY